MEAYSDKKHNILSKIYNLRALSFNQIKTYIFENQSERYCQKIVNELVKDNLLEKNGHTLDNSYYYLTRKGMTYLKKNSIIMIGGGLWYDADNVKTPAQLKISTLDHQLELNSFILEFEKRYANEGIKYYSEFTMNLYFSDIIRPDSIIETDDTIYFLEMDMNTERKTRLMQKWESYRRYLISPLFKDFGKKVKVFFILGSKIQNTATRERNLRQFILDNLEDIINPYFNLYIDTQDGLFDYLEKEKNTPANIKTSFQWKGFKCEKARFSEESISKYYYKDYIFKTDKDGSIVKESNSLMEFIVDDYTDKSLLVIKNIKAYPTFNTMFKKLRKREIKYLVIIDDIKEAVQMCELAGTYSDNIYFICMNDLKGGQQLTEILYGVGSDKEVYKVSSKDLRIRDRIEVKKGL